MQLTSFARRVSLQAVAPVALAVLASNVALAQGAFTDLGGGIASSNGLPTTQGFGSLYPGTTTVIRLAGAAPLASTACIIGFTQAAVPGSGPAIVPAFDIVASLSTDIDGNASFTAIVPLNIGYGTELFVQWLTIDSTSSYGFTLSNALAASTFEAELDPVSFYAEVAADCTALLAAGEGNTAMLEWILENPAALQSNLPFFLDLITPTEIGPGMIALSSNSPNPVVYGQRYALENIFGMTLTHIQMEATTNFSACTYSIDTVIVTGGWLLLYTEVLSLSSEPTVHDCPSGPCHFECSQYAIKWGQKVNIVGAEVVISTFVTPIETLCAICAP